MPPGPRVLYVLGTRTSHGRTVRTAHRGTPGGEWLELGRWLGGPPLPEMEWEVGLDANRRRLLLRLCLRTTEALAASANALRDHGPFELYRAPPG